MGKTSEISRVAVLSFYKFVDLDGLLEIRDSLLSVCGENDISGTLILASEGINATVAGPPQGVEKLMVFLESDPRLLGAQYKLSYNEKTPFHRLKVKFKKELVPMGVEGVKPQCLSGQRVPPEQWNDLISRPDVLLIDTRNDYENRVGTFRGAVNPKTEHFREFAGYVRENLDPGKHKEIAMFCTGGIRCEKATSYLLERDFKRVYQLEGGVLSYLERIPSEQSLWEGECFVFDDRTSVGQNLSRGTWSTCHNCRAPVSESDRRSEGFREGISCPHCHDRLTPERISSLEERQKQMRLARERNRKHLGAVIKRERANRAVD
ncbi:MAG: rhodanese-related sulfurtransferase [Candidatus Dadabacteria bacterium]|nr:rhodanese-related sulfurtransferase [Candidatus Dadabacteria bacterium]